VNNGDLCFVLCLSMPLIIITDAYRTFSSYIRAHATVAYVDNDNDNTCCRLSVTQECRKHNKLRGNVYLCMRWHFYNYLLLQYYHQCWLSTNNRGKENYRRSSLVYVRDESTDQRFDKRVAEQGIEQLLIIALGALI
jgi:hypothetical protein